MGGIVINKKKERKKGKRTHYYFRLHSASPKVGVMGGQRSQHWSSPGGREPKQRVRLECYLALMLLLIT